LSVIEMPARPSRLGADRAGLHRLREKLSRALGDALAVLEGPGAELAGRVELVCQGLEARGCYAFSLILDEVFLAAAALDDASAARAAQARHLVREGLEVVRAGLPELSVGGTVTLGALRLVDDLRALRGAPLASASVPWTPVASTGAAPDLAPDAVRELARRLRPYMQKGLLGWLREASDPGPLTLLDAVLERLEATRGDQCCDATWPAGRAYVEGLAAQAIAPGPAARRLLGELDGALRRLGGTPAHDPADPATVASDGLARALFTHVLACGHVGPQSSRMRTLLGLPDSGLARALPTTERTDVARTLQAVADVLQDGGAARPAAAELAAALTAAADGLAFLNEGVARREVLAQAAALEDPVRCAAVTMGLRRIAATLAATGPGAAASVAPGDDDAALPASMLGNLDRARSMMERMGDAAVASQEADDWLPPELRAALAGGELEGPVDADEPEPTLEGIDLGDLAARARHLLAESPADVPASKSGEQGGPASPPPLAQALRAEGLVLDSEALENLTAVAGAMGESHSDLERRVGSLRAGLTDMAQTITGLRDQVQSLAGAGATVSRTTGEAPPAGFDARLAASLGERIAGLSAGIDELASLHDAVARLTHETESLLVRQARDQVELRRGLMRTRLVPVASHLGAWRNALEEAADGSRKGCTEVLVEGGEVRVDQAVLSGVSPIVEVILARLAEIEPDPGKVPVDAGTPGVVRLTVCALVADGDLNLELRGPATAPAGLDLAEAEAAALELGGALCAVDGDESTTVLMLRVPLAPPLARVLTVAVGEEVLALPMDAVAGVVRTAADEIIDEAGGSSSVIHAGRRYPWARLDELLDLAPDQPRGQGRGHVVLLKGRSGHVAVEVDEICDRREVVTKAIGPQLGTIALIEGACIMGGDRPVLILDPERIASRVFAERTARPVSPLASWAPEG
jgi:chemotaxis protein histidine kinase CheA